MIKNSLIISLKKSRKFKVFLFLVSFVVVQRFCHNKTEGFQVTKMLSDLTYHEEWETPKLCSETAKEIKGFLNQPYYFLKSGGQCYTFLSEDKQYVLKVFKHHHMRVNHILNNFTLPGKWDRYRLKLMGGNGSETPQERLTNLFKSCKIAYDELQDQTSLLFLHLNKTDHLKQKITLIDKLGIAHSFDLDSIEYALQRKAILVYPTLRESIKKNDIETAKARINSLIELVYYRAKEGIVDLDPIINRNFGFVNGRAMGIDIGCFKKDPTINPDAEVERIIGPLIEWLDKKDPELAAYGNHCITDLKKGNNPINPVAID